MQMATGAVAASKSVPSFSALTKKHLPVEVWELVIDHLHDDFQALLACSLTCTAFVSRSRRHLWKRIVLTNKEHANHFAQAFLDDRRNWNAVRELVISGELFVRQEGSATPLIFPALSNLRTVVICDLQVDAYEDALACLLPLRRSITRLSLSGARFQTFPLLAAFILNFQNLQSLALSHVSSVKTIMPADVEQYAPQLPLTVFDFRLSSFYNQYRESTKLVLASRIATPTLACLRLRVPLGTVVAGDVERLVTMNKATLHTLVIDYGAAGYDDLDYQFGPEKLALPRLQVGVPILATETCENLLRQLPAPNALEDLSLVFSAYDDGTPPTTRFLRIRRLRPLFEENLFPRLQRFHVRCQLLETEYGPPDIELVNKDFVLGELLPNAPRHVWTDDLEERFERFFEI